MKAVTTKVAIINSFHSQTSTLTLGDADDFLGYGDESTQKLKSTSLLQSPYSNFKPLFVSDKDDDSHPESVETEKGSALNEVPCKLTNSSSSGQKEIRVEQ